jgi:MipA family protein
MKPKKDTPLNGCAPTAQTSPKPLFASGSVVAAVSGVLAPRILRAGFPLNQTAADFCAFRTARMESENFALTAIQARPRPSRAVVASVALAAAFGLSVQAQEKAPQQAFASSSADSHLTVSFGANRSSTTLSGTANPRSKWGPLLDVDYTNGPFYASTSRGLGYNVVATKQLTVGLGLGYQFGRKESADVVLKGMGDVKGSPQLLASADWNPLDDFIHVYASAAASTRRDSGKQLTVGATLAYPIVSKLIGTVDVSLLAADARYLQAYYGVTPVQAAVTGYAVKTPSAGIVSASFSTGLSYELTDRWKLNAAVGATRLRGDAASSPITVKRTLPNASVSASYSFF